MRGSEEFALYLKRGGRSPSAINQILAYIGEFERYLEAAPGRDLEDADPGDLEAFVQHIESKPKASAKKHLWALRYYYAFIANDEMRCRAGELRQGRIKRRPFALARFRGVNPEYVARLETVGIKDVEHMLRAGRTTGDRHALSERTGVPLEAVLEFVKLSDLSRVGATKTVRARLYYDAGIDTPAKIARFEPEDFRATLLAFVERTDFDGIAPLPKEARNSVFEARKLPQAVEYLDEEDK